MLASLKSLLPRASLSYFKKYPLLGLDLGYDELRLLQLEKRADEFHIEKMVIQPLLSENKEQEKKDSWEQSATALLSLVKQNDLQGYPVAFALPSSAAIKKQIESPSYNEKEFVNELKLGFSRYFPDLPENEVHYDFVMKPSAGETHSACVVAARKEPIERLVKMARYAGLKAELIDIDLYAMARTAAFYFYPCSGQKKQVVAVLNLGWPVFSFIAFTSQDLIFHHQWCLDRAIFERPLDYADQMTQQLRSAWQLCLATHPKLKIEFLGVAGEVAQLNELALHFERQLSHEVKVINPFQAMTHASQLQRETIHHLSPRFLLCFGLALRGLQ